MGMVSKYRYDVALYFHMRPLHHFHEIVYFIRAEVTRVSPWTLENVPRNTTQRFVLSRHANAVCVRLSA
jgi:hypothetical protein